MAPKRFSSLFVAAAALLLLITAGHVEARKASAGVNPFCRTSDYRRLCTTMINGATNLNQASANAMKTTLEVARRAQTMVRLLKPAIAHLEPQSQASIMTTCTDHFDSTVSDIEESIEALQAKDMGAVLAKLSAAYRSDCVDELSQFGVEVPFGNILSLLKKQVSNCLAVVQQN